MRASHLRKDTVWWCSFSVLCPFPFKFRKHSTLRTLDQRRHPNSEQHGLRLFWDFLPVYPPGPLIQWTPLCFSGTSSSGLAGQVEGMGKAKDKTACPRPGPMPKAVLPGTRRARPELAPARPVLAAV